MKKLFIVGLVLLSLIFLALAVYYWAVPAGSLMHSLPGYEAGSAHKHLKHGLAAFIVALGLAAWAWFASGNKSVNSSGS